MMLNIFLDKKKEKFFQSLGKAKDSLILGDFGRCCVMSEVEEVS